MATEKVDILQINTEPSRTSVKDLRKEMKSLKDELLNLMKVRLNIMQPYKRLLVFNTH